MSFKGILGLVIQYKNKQGADMIFSEKEGILK